LKRKARPAFVRISDAMKEWSSVLGAELLTWPSVTSRLMFGMTVFYRRGAIFAALPRTRCFETSNSIAFKLYDKSPRIRKLLESDPRIANTLRPDARWITLELASDKDLAGALKWFDVAYRACSSKTSH
jgi:hypothetical protein